MTAKFSHLSDDDYEVLKFTDFQWPSTSNSKAFKALFCFQGLLRFWKMDTFLRTFKEVWPPWT